MGTCACLRVDTGSSDGQHGQVSRALGRGSHTGGRLPPPCPSQHCGEVVESPVLFSGRACACWPSPGPRKGVAVRTRAREATSVPASVPFGTHAVVQAGQAVHTCPACREGYGARGRSSPPPRGLASRERRAVGVRHPCPHYRCPSSGLDPSPSQAPGPRTLHWGLLRALPLSLAGHPGLSKLLGCPFLPPTLQGHSSGDGEAGAGGARPSSCRVRSVPRRP